MFRTRNQVGECPPYPLLSSDLNEPAEPPRTNSAFPRVSHSLDLSPGLSSASEALSSCFCSVICKISLHCHEIAIPCPRAPALASAPAACSPTPRGLRSLTLRQVLLQPFLLLSLSPWEGGGGHHPHCVRLHPVFCPRVQLRLLCPLRWATHREAGEEANEDCPPSQASGLGLRLSGGKGFLLELAQRCASRIHSPFNCPSAPTFPSSPHKFVLPTVHPPMNR